MILSLNFSNAEVEIVFDEEQGDFRVFVYYSNDDFSRRVIKPDYDEDPCLLETRLTDIITSTIIELVGKNVFVRDAVREFVSHCIYEMLNEDEVEYEFEEEEVGEAEEEYED